MPTCAEFSPVVYREPESIHRHLHKNGREWVTFSLLEKGTCSALQATFFDAWAMQGFPWMQDARGCWWPIPCVMQASKDAETEDLNRAG